MGQLAQAAFGIATEHGGWVMSTLFISHSSTDIAAAREMADWLQRHGHHSLFLDFDPEHGIPPGRDWEAELYRRLRACQALIVLCSEPAMASCWCLAELSHARALGKRIFPVRIAPCQLRPQLAELQVIDLVKEPEAGFERLRQGLISVFDWDRHRPPYPGLMAFEEVDAAIFFGRDAETQQALDRLQQLRHFGGPRLLLFLGASGSGKSSLVRAGIMPRLRAVPDAWTVIGPIRPRDRPLDEFTTQLRSGLADDGGVSEEVLALASGAETASQLLPRVQRELRRRPGRANSTLVLVIDQLEELLSDSPQAEQLMRVLAPVLRDTGTPVLVIATLRSDFLGALQDHPAWRDVPLQPLTVEPLSMEGFAAVIEGPAELAGLELEPGLVRAMVADTATQDALPLLAFTLRELWEAGGEDGRLTLAEYRDRLGGLHGSVARSAEAVLDAAAPSREQWQALRIALFDLVRLDEEGRYTRQAVHWEALPAMSHPLLERFIQARLLIAGSHHGVRTLEVAHESLFRVWRRLNRWLEDNREALRVRDGLRRAASEWDVGGRSAELLVHRGNRLEAARALTGAGAFRLDAMERDYLQACRWREWMRRGWITAAWLALLLGVIGLSWFAWSLHQQERITRQGLADLHWANGVSARDRDGRPLKASHHFMQAAELALDPERAASAHWAGVRLGSGPVLAGAMDLGPVLMLAAFDGDDDAGDRVRLWGSDGGHQAWSWSDGAAPPLLGPGGRTVQTFSPGGQPWTRRIVLRGDERGTEIRDRRSGALLVTLPPAVEGVWIGGVDEATAVSVHRGGDARIWDLTSGDSLGEWRHAAGVAGVAISPSGARLLLWTRSGEAVVWSVDAAEVVARHAGDILGGALGRQAHEVVLWNREGRLWLPALPAFEPAAAEGGRCSPRAIGARFLDDARRLLVWNHGACGTARLWDLETQRPVGAVVRHEDELAPPLVQGSRFLTWHPGGGSARLWDGATGEPVATLEAPVTGARFAGGNRLLTWSGSDARLWSSLTGEPLGLPLRHAATVREVVASEDGRRLLSRGSDGSLRWWQTPPTEAAATRRFPAEVLDAALVADEPLVRAVTLDGHVHSWSAIDDTVPERQRLDPEAVLAVFAPEGRRLLTAGVHGDVRLWSWEDDAFRALAAPGGTAGDGPVAGVVWSPDADRLLFWGERGCTAWLWRVGSARSVPIEPDAEGAECRLRGAAFVNDERARLLTWGEDRRLRLWDVEAREPVLLRTLLEGALVRHAEFDAGRLLVTTGDGGVHLSSVQETSGQDGDEADRAFHHEAAQGARRHADTGRVLSWGGGSVRIWEADGAALLASLAPGGDIAGAAFVPGGERVLSWQTEGRVQLWDTVSGHPLTPALRGGGPAPAGIDSDFGTSAIRLLVTAGARATLWRLPPFHASPSRPVRRQQVLTGTRLTSPGEVEVLSAAAWRRLATDLAGSGE
ncbi:TIR domain-containing protein [Halomonas sp. EGI 63088]|uniref:TIR domain-containing protein n=1 Tax=Halomonas flagellata TaxID=2920385 RepID=A0ABS9RXM8_9GAMM|nr:TIR domain-containing protein [Halomonas flagellata]MCH4564540.1 TIR domain-containing protein [Halomonas flagellata]